MGTGSKLLVSIDILVTCILILVIRNHDWDSTRGESARLNKLTPVCNMRLAICSSTSPCGR